MLKLNSQTKKTEIAKTSRRILKTKKFWIITIFSILVFSLIGVGSYFSYRFYRTSKSKIENQALEIEKQKQKIKTMEGEAKKASERYYSLLRENFRLQRELDEGPEVVYEPYPVYTEPNYPDKMIGKYNWVLDRWEFQFQDY